MMSVLPLPNFRIFVAICNQHLHIEFISLIFFRILEHILRMINSETKAGYDVIGVQQPCLNYHTGQILKYYRSLKVSFLVCQCYLFWEFKIINVALTNWKTTGYFSCVKWNFTS